MEILTPDTEEAEQIADQWVALAEGQRGYGSHLLAEPNRDAIRVSIVRHVVSDELLVAREDNELLGFVMFTVESGKYEQDVTRGLIENLYVVPRRRNEGIGSELLEAAETELAEAGAETIALEVVADNEEARRFYRRHGYDPHRVELERSLESDTL
ncbi:MAG: GNAT family N-acetyltransferase [Haloarculaceae archaeon]